MITLAWTTVEYKCGHVGQEQLYGPGKDREWQARSFGNKLCQECQSAYNAKQAERSVAAGLAVLTGSEKQIAYGETCRKSMLGNFDKVAENYKKAFASGAVLPGKQEEANQALAHLMAAIEYAKANKASAGYWLDAWKSSYNGSKVKHLLTALMNETPAPSDKPDTKSVMARAWEHVWRSASGMG